MKQYLHTNQVIKVAATPKTTKITLDFILFSLLQQRKNNVNLPSLISPIKC